MLPIMLPRTGQPPEMSRILNNEIVSKNCLNEYDKGFGSHNSEGLSSSLIITKLPKIELVFRLFLKEFRYI